MIQKVTKRRDRKESNVKRQFHIALNKILMYNTKLINTLKEKLFRYPFQAFDSISHSFHSASFQVEFEEKIRQIEKMIPKSKIDRYMKENPNPLYGLKKKRIRQLDQEIANRGLIPLKEMTEFWRSPEVRKTERANRPWIFGSVMIFIFSIPIMILVLSYMDPKRDGKWVDIGLIFALILCVILLITCAMVHARRVQRQLIEDLIAEKFMSRGKVVNSILMQWNKEFFLPRLRVFAYSGPYGMSIYFFLVDADTVEQMIKDINEGGFKPFNLPEERRKAELVAQIIQPSDFYVEEEGDGDQDSLAYLDDEVPGSKPQSVFGSISGSARGGKTKKRGSKRSGGEGDDAGIELASQDISDYLNPSEDEEEPRRPGLADRKRGELGGDGKEAADDYPEIVL